MADTRQEAIEKQNWIKVATMFCQHCKAIQKVYNYPAKCLYNPSTEEGQHAFCADCVDMANSILRLPVKDLTDLPLEMPYLKAWLVGFAMRCQNGADPMYDKAIEQLTNLIKSSSVP